MNRYRYSTDEWCFDFATFRRLDYGKVCAQLGLRPSRPRDAFAKANAKHRARS